MSGPLPDADLVVATPERVAFDYQVAGLGTRALAQVLDLLILSGVLVGVWLAAIAISAFGQDTLGGLVAIIGSFAIVFGYFWASEAFWSGQTVGKRVFRLRAVGDRGEPLTLAQAGIRNVVRLVDFLPYFYGVGFVVLFLNGRGKRLGDLAAGTVVVKDSDHIALWQLSGGRPVPPPPPSVPPPSRAPAAPPRVELEPASDAELALRRLDPELRRFVSAYAARRAELPLPLRAQLAGQIQPRLREAAQEVFDRYGPLAALDHLANLDRQV
jgi:uncharacterized RDD family membrane protein YckC